MRIFQVNASDIGGGSEKVSYDLFKQFSIYGHESYLVVGTKRCDNSNVIEISHRHKPRLLKRTSKYISRKLKPYGESYVGINYLRNIIEVIGDGVKGIYREIGYEDFNFPKWDKFFNNIAQSADIIHLHNLHGKYFDLRSIAPLSHRIPLVLTLHDAWLLSGHCAHSFDCDRWKIGCGQCPNLNTYPAVKRDLTDLNWRRKRKIYSRSKLYISTPSQWLMNKAKESILWEGMVEARVIPNGVDLNIFKPGIKETARKRIGLPPSGVVILFIGNNAKHNEYKNYPVLKKALIDLQVQLNDKIYLIVVGSEGLTEVYGNLEIRYYGREFDSVKIANFYQSSDMLVHPAIIDTFPNVIIESLACGTPVIGSSVGGIPEQIEDGKTGFLVPPNDVERLIEKIKIIIENQELKLSMTVEASSFAKSNFDLSKQSMAYLSWYEYILSNYNKK